MNTFELGRLHATPGRPACPPWCGTNHENYLGCVSAHDLIRGPEHTLTAYAVRSATLGDRVAVQGTGPFAERCAVWLSAEDAGYLAGVVGVLAAATPDEHRALAAQLRAAAGALTKENPDDR